MKVSTKGQSMPPGTIDALCNLYERLRNHVLLGSALPGEGCGFGVMLRQGMQAWIDSSLQYGQVDSECKCDAPLAAPSYHPSVQTELTKMLAYIVMNNHHKEV